MTNDKTPIFVDTNVLIRLHVSTAPQYELVREAIKRLLVNRYEIWISRQVLREYAAVLTRAQPYTANPLSPRVLAEQLRQFEVNLSYC